MKYLRRINESDESIVTLRDLIGSKPGRARTANYNAIVIETSKGCFTNIDLEPYPGQTSILDKEAKFGRISGEPGELTSSVIIKGEGDRYWSQIGYCYIVPSDGPLGYDVKILSYWPGDERGCLVFNNTFICSGHDGSYLWDINDPSKFVSNTY